MTPDLAQEALLHWFPDERDAPFVRDRIVTAWYNALTVPVGMSRMWLALGLIAGEYNTMPPGTRWWLEVEDEPTTPAMRAEEV